jgi:hypothetical protein
MLLRHAVVVAEGWWHPYRLEAPHVLFSLSKSFTSSAVGLAVAEGLLSVEDPLLKFFPDDSPKKIGRNLADMQVLQQEGEQFVNRACIHLVVIIQHQYEGVQHNRDFIEQRD